MPELLSKHLRRSLDNHFAVDWDRQRRTAEDILRRLKTQEGVILADQVGMGKTYVALTVAVTEILAGNEAQQVVAFVPARVAQKWVDEWAKFREALLEPSAPDIRCVDAPIRSGEDFLRLLDDPADRRKHLVVVTHTALTATLKDRFIHLALLSCAVRNRRGASDIRARIARWSEQTHGLIPDIRFTPDRVARLLSTPTSTWRKEWHSLTGEDLGDDPVPRALDDISSVLDLETVWEVVRDLPARRSLGLKKRLKAARAALNDATQLVWKQALAQANIRLPLLIVDEAHALKNDQTRISRLFSPHPDHPTDGALAGIFDRILLLTATPFELGHNELINVLHRLEAVRPLDPPPAHPLDQRLADLESALYEAQVSALRFDESWSKITEADICAFDSWSPDATPDTSLDAHVVRAWRDAQLTVRARQHMHSHLQPWLIRHERPHRRDYLCGAAILTDGSETDGGLPIRDEDAMPFLLAARAQAIASEEGAPRPLFAYGIASSYETYLRLEAGSSPLDSDIEPSDEETPAHTSSGTVAWYHRYITGVLASEERRRRHPKVEATVERASALWIAGEKCLIFCWYIRTTAALRDALRRRVDDLVEEKAAELLGVSRADGIPELQRISRRLFDSTGSSHRAVHDYLVKEFDAAVNDIDLAEHLSDIALRNLRTPANLVRYTHVSRGMDSTTVLRGIAGENPAGIDVLGRWTAFAVRLAATTESEREKTLMNLEGEHDGSATPDGRGASLTQVRRAYGGTRRQDRERLIAVFNTPFAPDILVASSVMGEGIDLHQECRHVIHHDLDWNPSKLEQRTGRLDRIGSLAERAGRNIQVYEPYLAGTHDEKMFRVVKDRAAWFDVVMGRDSSSDEWKTDAEESRTPLPDRIRRELALDLRSSATIPIGT
ncbi:helicase-related protein [Rhodococcus sp. NPDC003383]